MKPKGTLILIGGKEDKKEDITDDGFSDCEASERFEILKHLLSSKPSETRLEIITSGTAYPRESFETYRNLFEKFGVRETGMIDIDSRNKASEPDYIDKINNATAVLFGGGNQRKIMELFEKTKFQEALKKKFEEDSSFILAGTSAGAMIMGDIMIGDGRCKMGIVKGDVDTRPGLGLIPNLIIDTHFTSSKRLTRLSLACLENPQAIGLGIPENTALIVKDGELISCIGTGCGFILDASSVGKNNVESADRSEKVYAENMVIHFLGGEAVFSLKKKSFEKSREKVAARS